MRKIVVIEGILLLITGLVGVVEGVHLIIRQDPNVTHDILGPSGYIIAVSVALMITGTIYIIHCKKNLSGEKLAVSKETIIRVIKIVLIMAVYSFVIDVIGYFLATVVFFFLILRVLGFTSWLTNVILTIVFSTSLYIIFLRFLGLVFPRGILFP